MSLKFYRKKEKDFLESLIEYPNNFSGRGIVTACGSKECFYVGAYVQIKLLRQFGCDLPVEVWKFSWEKEEKWDSIFNDMDNVVVKYYNEDIAEVERKGWTLKPYAIRDSSFKEVLFLDSDIAPTKDPTYLFDYEQYKEKGAIFWSDTCTTHTTKVRPTHKIKSRNAFWHLAGVEEIQEREFESGQIVIDKEKCWEAINLTCHYNNHADWYYKFFLGDKETFHLAWRRLKKDFVFFQNSYHTDVPGGKFFWQYDMNNDLLFQHRSGNKFHLNGNITEPKFVEQDKIFNYIEELNSLIIK